MTTPPDYDIAVIGGGLAGLTAAVVAARAGKSVAVFEKASHFGGRATTSENHGFLFNQGPHALYRAGRGATVLKQLGIPYSGHRASYEGSWVLANGQPHPMPTSSESLSESSFLTRAGTDELLSLRSRLADHYPTREWDLRSIRDWLDTQIVQPEVRMLFEGQIRLATYCGDLTAQSAGAVLDQMIIAAAAGVDYLDGGWETLVQGLEKEACAAGAVLHTRQTITTLTFESPHARLHFAESASCTARAVISTLPPTAIARVTGEDRAPSLGHWAKTLQPIYAGCLDVALRALPCPEHQFAIGLDQPLYYSVHTRSARLAPEGGALIQLAKYLAPHGENGAEELREELESLLTLFQPGWRNVLIHQRFLPRMLVANTVVTPGGRPPVKVPEIPNLFLAGDWVGSEGMLVDASLASAGDAAQFALDWLHSQAHLHPAGVSLLSA